ncbi:glycosyltransferase [Calothrix sp. NIES-4101]|nr:glycosyltransferase [Calothrix sp. NIES-4101]
MKISVIISNYNYARYLTDAIDSVLNQSYQNFEIIIVDDGSKDNSHEVISKFQEQYPDRIKAIFQANQGQGEAFNTGFATASGEIIAFLDADDIWLPNKLERVVEEFKRPEIVGVMHPLDTIDASGNKLESDSANIYHLGEDLAKVIINTGNAWGYPPTSGLTYRRSILEKVFPIDSVKWRLWADGCIIYTTAFLGKIKTIDEPLAGYRIHGANNHINVETNSVCEESALSGIEMTNEYINQFLEKINYPRRVDISRNLQYQRNKYYLKGVWNFQQAWKISRLILGWEFYTWSERLYYFARFVMKNTQFILRSGNSGKNPKKVFAD